MPFKNSLKIVLTRHSHSAKMDFGPLMFSDARTAVSNTSATCGKWATLLWLFKVFYTCPMFKIVIFNRIFIQKDLKILSKYFNPHKVYFKSQLSIQRS